MLLEIIKLLIPIILLIVLISLKVELYISIFAGGILLGALFGLTPLEMLELAAKTTVEMGTVQLLIIIFMVLLLGQILKAKESLKVFVEAIGNILKKKSLIISVSPAMIGLLPMPGGALVSAPILNEVLKEDTITPAFKTYVNFWFRHIWEYVWPLYPGLILCAGIFNVEFVSIFKHQFYFTILVVLIGALALKLWFPKVKEKPAGANSVWRNLFLLFKGLWEIALIIIIVIVINLEAYLAIAAVVLFSFIILRKPLKEKLKLLKQAFNPSMLLTIIAVMMFKAFIQNSQVKELTRSLVEGAGDYKYLIMFFVPFIIGFLTGVNSAFAGISFPLFISIVGEHNPDMWKIMYLYVSGFSGVLLSPVHFCLVLSAQYYKAKLKDVYKYLVPSVAIIIIVATAIIIIKG